MQVFKNRKWKRKKIITELYLYHNFREIESQFRESSLQRVQNKETVNHMNQTGEKIAFMGNTKPPSFDENSCMILKRKRRRRVVQILGKGDSLSFLLTFYSCDKYML